MTIENSRFLNILKPRTGVEKIRNRIDLAVWDDWHHLLTFIGDPASRPPPIGSGYIIS